MFEKINDFKEIFKKAVDVGSSQEESDVLIRERSTIIERIKNMYLGLYENLQHITLFPYDSRGSIIEEARSFLTSIKDTKEKSDKAFDVIKGFALKTGAQLNINDYGEAASAHAKKASRWLICGIFLLIILILSLIYLIVNFLDYFKENQLAWGYVEIGSGLVVFCWIYAIFFCSKNYYTEKHNEIVNAHKARSLTTYNPLSKGTEDKDTQDQLLLHVCTAIFANTTTGFNKNQDTPSLPILEIIKQIKNIFK